MTVLADSNVLIALTVAEHEHHRAVASWFDTLDEPLATCPVTQGSLVRFLVREGISASEAARVVDHLAGEDWHRFLPDDLGYSSQMLAMVVGHRQVTDAYLAALAAHHDSTVTTLDRGFAALYPDAVTLISTS